MITVKTYFFNYRVFVDCDRANNVIEKIFFSSLRLIDTKIDNTFIYICLGN